MQIRIVFVTVCISSYQPKHLIQAATKQTQAHTFHDRNSPSVQDIALKRSTLVINFCRHGLPRADGVPDCPRYESDGRRCLVVSDNFEVVSDPDRLHRSMCVS